MLSEKEVARQNDNKTKNMLRYSFHLVSSGFVKQTEHWGENQ